MLHYLLLIHSLKAETLTLQESLSLVKSQSPEVQIARLQSDQSNLERIKVLTNIVRADASGSWLNFGEPLDVYLIGNGNTRSIVAVLRHLALASYVMVFRTCSIKRCQNI